MRTNSSLSLSLSLSLCRAGVLAAVTGIVAAPAAAQMGAFGPTGPNADHPPGLKDGWLKTFGSDEGLADFATECSALGYGLVAMGGEYRGELLDEGDATVAPTSASSGSTWYPAGFVAAAEQDGSNFWSRGMVGEASGGLRGSARTNAVTFAHPDVIGTPTLFAGGSYQNTVEFDTVGTGLQKTAVGTSTNDCFVASFDVDGDDINWVTTFPSVTSTANDAVFGVSATPEFKPWEPGGGGPGNAWPGNMDPTTDPPTGTPPPGSNADPVSVIAACGGFRGTIDFDESDPGGARETSAGDEDGFLVLLDQQTGDYIAHLTFGSSTGDDRAFAVAAATAPEEGPTPEPYAAQAFYVCGFYSADAVFPGIEDPVPAVGGRDLFVARAVLIDDDGDLSLSFDWLYTFGTDEHDVARRIAVHPRLFLSDVTYGIAKIAFTGWSGGGSASGRDLIVGSIDDDVWYGTQLQWQHELTDNDETDDAGLGVAWDANSRVVAVGQFGIERAPHSIPETASFDPAGGDDKTTWGGWDAFVARYSVNGTYIDAAYYGYNYNEWATSVVIDPGSERLWISGVFGHSNASTAYNLGFGTALPAYCRGGSDMFWLCLEPELPESLDGMLSIVLDSSGSMQSKWLDVQESIVRIFEEEPFTIRRTGGLAVNVVQFGMEITETVPWTIIDESTWEGFVAALDEMQFVNGGTFVWDGMAYALTRFESKTTLLALTDVEDRLMLVIGDGIDGDMTGKRAALESDMQGLGWPAEVAGVPIDNGSPADVATWYWNDVVSLSQANPSKAVFHHAKRASDPSDPDHFEYKFRRALKELTCCRADFDGDGEHDLTPDTVKFMELYNMVPDGHPAADLNYDGDWTPADITVFQSYQMEACPCDD